LKFKVSILEIPEWICSTICAGLNIEDLLDGQGITEPSEEAIETPTIQSNNLHMNTEEGMTINTKRKGFDYSMDTPVVIQVARPGTLYNGKHECELTSIKYTDCMEKGAEISSWISERILNPSKACN